MKEGSVIRDLVIIGAGGFGRELITYIQEINQVEPTWSFLGFIDDSCTETPEGYPVIGGMDTLLDMDSKPYFVIAIANSRLRESIADRCKQAGLQAATIIHPSCRISTKCTIGEGTILCRECNVNTNVSLGRFCIVNNACSFGHDAIVGDYNSFMSRTMIAGDTTIGNHCYFGLRCTMINSLRVTDQCTFGACSCIVKDAIEPGTYVGVPAVLKKPLQK